jgi:excisionase family DNA binding protein
MRERRQLWELPDMLTVKQVSEFLGIGLKQTYELLHFGRLPCQHFGARLVVSRYDLAEFVNAPPAALHPPTADADDE